MVEETNDKDKLPEQQDETSETTDEARESDAPTAADETSANDKSDDIVDEVTEDKVSDAKTPDGLASDDGEVEASAPAVEGQATQTSSPASSDASLKAPRGARQAIEPETPPPPPKRSKAVRHPVVVFMNFVFFVLLLGVVGIAGVLYYGKQTFIEAGPLKQEKTILVSRGTDLGTIAGILERQNVISDETIFAYGVRLYRQEGQLKAGEYLFNPGLSMHQVMTILTSGKSILHSVTIPEGYTSYQAHQVLLAHEILSGELAEVPPEGSILPETYKFSRGTTRAEMLKRMTDARNRALDEIWARRASDLPLKDKEELVTLASIVEKETGQAAERTRVAGVFVNRLNQGMRLQSDPTVIYGVFGGQGKPRGRPIFRSDLDKKTPYNTYQIDGLTPGPIANPGRAALEAVANPSRTNDLFFVADGTGGHVFAETLKQHNINVKRWRAIEKQRIEALKKKEAEQKAKESN